MKSKQDYWVMLDLETLSVERNAAILSIGAVSFDLDSIVDEFYINIDPRSCVEASLHVCVNTLQFWKNQRPEAYASLKNNRTSLKDALLAFSEWFGPKTRKTFSNGSDFDGVILRNAYMALGMTPPYAFYDSLCYRTIVSLMGKHSIPARSGIHHNALDDAKNQTLHLQNILNGKG